MNINLNLQDFLKNFLKIFKLTHNCNIFYKRNSLKFDEDFFPNINFLTLLQFLLHFSIKKCVILADLLRSACEQSDRIGVS